MTWELLPVAGVGFLVGVRHAFEPDHLAAVTTLATRERGWGQAARLGVAWGAGHTLSVAVVALILAGLHIRVPDRFHAVAEMGVATLLIALGISTLWREALRHRASLGVAHAAAHRKRHTHRHPAQERSAARALAFGLAHGLAGSGAVMVVLVAATANLRDQMLYLGAFGLGTMTGMTGVSLLTGLVTGAVARSNRNAVRSLRVGAALTSTAVGLMLGWNTLHG